MGKSDTEAYQLATRVVWQAIPNALSQLAMVLVGFVTVMFVSQLHDSDVLGGVGVGSMLYNIFGLSLGVGLTSGLDTLVSHSNGAGRFEQSGVHLQRAVVVCSSVCILSCVFLFFTEDLLVAIGQDAQVSLQAGQYVRGALPSMWFLYMNNAIGTYLRAQTIPHASVYATWTANVFHLFSCYFFICQLGMGAFGAGLAFSATQLVSCVMLLGYVHFIRPGVTQQSWVPWDCRRATSNVRSFLEKALPCAMLMWTEWWCAELMTLMAGYLGSAALAAHTAVLQVFVLVFMTSGGISCAGAALVGNAVGEGSAELAKRSAISACVVMLVAGSLIDLGIWRFAEPISGLFTHTPEVREKVRSLLNLLLLVVPLDCLQTVIDGILRGLGKQALAFKVKVLCMWGVRMPTAAYFAFQAGWGIEGIWFGSAAGLFMTMVIYVLIVLGINWEQEVTANFDYQQLSPQSRPRGNSGLEYPPRVGEFRTPTGIVMVDDETPFLEDPRA